MRLFRRRPKYRFEGRIHEQKTQAMPTYLPERFETTSIRMLHYGYLKSRVSDREKSQRNLELLQQEAREAPGPFVDFNLGSEYIALGRFALARTHLDRGWIALQREPSWSAKGYAPMLAARLVQARREAGAPAAARQAIDEALAYYPDHTELVLQAAMCARDERKLDEAARLAERCLELGDAPAKYGAAVGVGTYLARSLLAEIRTDQGRTTEAEEQYRHSLEQYPDYIAPVLPLASLEIARGAEPGELCTRLAAERPSAALLLATALYEGGRSTEAEALFRDVLAARPGNGVARIGLVETLLARRAYAEAAAEARLEPADSLVGAAAARAELFARAASADAPQLAAALESAPGRGVPDHDVALYRAWLALLSGGEAPASLPTAAALTTFTALEALLRVVDIDAFATLHQLPSGSRSPRANAGRRSPACTCAAASSTRRRRSGSPRHRRRPTRAPTSGSPRSRSPAGSRRTPGRSRPRPPPPTRKHPRGPLERDARRPRGARRHMTSTRGPLKSGGRLPMTRLETGRGMDRGRQRDMVDGITPVDGTPTGTPAPSARAAAASRPFAVTGAGQLPDLPPAEVLDALDTAARVLHELDRKQVKVRLDHDPVTNELHAHVSDGTGAGEHAISHARLLNVLGGDTASLHTKG